MDTLKLNDKYISLPCDNDHFFHIESCENCEGILPWLKENNTCPICRYELPVEEPEEQEEQEVEQGEQGEQEEQEEQGEQGEQEEQGEQGEPFRLNRAQSDMLMFLYKIILILL